MVVESLGTAVTVSMHFKEGIVCVFNTFFCFLVFAVLHLYVLLRDVAVLSI